MSLPFTVQSIRNGKVGETDAWSIQQGKAKAASVLRHEGNKWRRVVSPPGCLTPGEEVLGTHFTGGWVGPRAGVAALETRKNLLSLKGIQRFPLGPALADLLY